MTDRQQGPQGGTGLKERQKDEVKKPKMYKVVLLNDDFTPMDFVVYILQKLYHKPLPEAMDIMLNVHQKGAGIAGVYTFEVAETKMMETVAAAKGEGHPLQVTVEPES